MSIDDVNYFHVRAESEREQARQATHPQAVKAHSELARAYLERLGSTGTQQSTDDA